MKNDSLYQGLCVAAVSLLALVSCEVWDDDRGGSNGLVEFSVDVPDDINGVPLTRSVTYADSPVVMLGEGGRDTLYLHASSEANMATVGEGGGNGVTRGVPVTTENFESVCKNFSVTAYSEGGRLFMADEEVTLAAEGVWSPSGGKRYWPEDELDFYAYAPYSLDGQRVFPDGVTITNGQTKTIEFSYTVPKGNGRDAEAQPDVMFATATCSRATTEGKKGTVPLEFSHALAAVKFVANDIAESTILRITLGGLYGQGVCTYDVGTGVFTWAQAGGKDNSYTQEFNVSVEDEISGSQPITDVHPETTFMLMPQQLDGATVEITLKTAKGETHTLKGRLDNGLKEWEAGKEYTYKISSESINWEYVFEVTPKVTFELGQTQKTYDVKSYRYRVTDESVVQNVPWTASLASSLEKKPLDENGSNWETVEKDVSKEITDFTASGMGGETNTTYDICVTGTDMSTTYGPDKDELKKEPTKGSAENPYDLSTENGSEPRNTANCYLVNRAGTYKLPLVYGNAIKQGADNPSAYDYSNFVDCDGKRITGPKVQGATDCALVWSDAFYMVKDVKLEKNGTDGYDYLVFTIDKDYIQQATPSSQPARTARYCGAGISGRRNIP